jgi:hypothetical protein
VALPRTRVASQHQVGERLSAELVKAALKAGLLELASPPANSLVDRLSLGHWQFPGLNGGVA